MRKTLLLAAAALVVVGAPALAFHDGGVAHCDGCHTMHNSEGGQGINDGLAPGQGFPKLLLYANKTDACLDCHDGDNGRYDVWATDPLAPNPEYGGGDFVFLEENNINDGHGGGDPARWIPGEEAGHSVISGIHSTGIDSQNAVAPGGTFDSGDLGCTSCHDPHGNDSFRLLYKTGQSVLGPTPITYMVTLEADGIPLSTSSGVEANDHHNAYQANYSEWCATCHGGFHSASANLIHPSGELMDTLQVAVYNKYNGTSDCIANPPQGPIPCGTGGPGTSYLAEVPFVDAGMATDSTAGPTDTTSYVACVSCHRAHASSARNAGRWDFSVTGLAEDGHESGSYTIPNPYDGFQRSLCNKCHSKDEYDEALDFTPAPAP